MTGAGLWLAGVIDGDTMQRIPEVEAQPRERIALSGRSLGRLLAAGAGLALTLFLLWQGFLFLRTPPNSLSQILITLIAIVWGVGGVAALYAASNALIEQLPAAATRVLLPFLFVGPALAILGWFLLIPTLRTLYTSFFDNTSTTWVGLQNYVTAFTDRSMRLSFRNNLLWMVLGTGACVMLGLLIAVLADRSKFETVAKAIIFMPMAISFVGAGVIWRFIYDYAPGGQSQIGLLNALVVAFGGSPQSWLQLLQPWNNYFLILVVIWMQTGFAMVIFSSAIKGVPEDLMEAARVDGANEFTIFFQIIVPFIQGTIVTVTTTIVIFMLKIFDVVQVMTGGQYNTEVVSTQFYRQNFINQNAGLGSTIAIVLFIAVIPVMIYNLRQLNKQEAF